MRFGLPSKQRVGVRTPPGAQNEVVKGYRVPSTSPPFRESDSLKEADSPTAF
jgi:hypothetical protein